MFPASATPGPSMQRAVKRQGNFSPAAEPSRKKEVKKSISIADVMAELKRCAERHDWRTVRSLLAQLQIDYLGVTSDDQMESVCYGLSPLLNSSPVDITCTILGILETVLENSPRKPMIWLKISFFFGAKSKLFKLRNDVDPALLSLYSVLLKHRLLKADRCEDVLRILWRNIRAGNCNQRVYAIKFLITYTLKGGLKSGKWTMRKLERELGPLCEDRDPRVRGAAIDGFISVSTEEQGLSFECYPVFAKLVGNSDKVVRLKCLRLIQKMAAKNGSKEVRSSKGVWLPINDDAFSIICNAVNDSDVQVRSEAAKLLGNFVNVSENFLLQTLDKKIMIKMKIRKDGSTYSGASEWSTGKRLGEDMPAERVEEDAQSIISTGACGAFVTALEDEFMAVRQPAVYSLGLLAANRPNFANACIEHLADMFNDEIEEVRLDAIKALTPLVVHGTLQKDQLPTILNVLDDAAQESRFALHELLGQSNLYDPECLDMCVKSLLHSMKRYPLDKSSTYRCLSKLGLNHAVFVQISVKNLLDLHSVFDNPEQTVDDPYYVAKLMLILNAASKHSTICSLLPSYVVRHYRYLRSCFPSLISPLKEMERPRLIDSRAIELLSNEKNASEKIVALLNSTYHRMVEVQGSDRHEEKEAAYLLIVSDLEALEEAEAEVSVPARYMKLFFDITRLGDYTHRTIVGGGNCQVTPSIIEQCLDRLDYLQFQFAGVDSSILTFIAEYRLFLILQHLTIRANSFKQLVVPYLKEAMELFEQQLHTIQRSATCTQVTKQVMSLLLRDVLHVYEDEKSKIPVVTSACLTNVLATFNLIPPKHFRSMPTLSMKAVDILEPTSEWISENVVKFVSNLPTGIPISAMMYHIGQEDLPNIRLKITYPDKVVTYFRPRMKDIIATSSSTHRLSTTVLVSANSWSDMAEVEICCGLLYQKQMQAIKKANNLFVPLPDHKKPSVNASVSVKVHPMHRL
ncbi:hypothetical protein L596_007282 [Steinernema carpocapsae]|uniref:Integrator complex subunit 4/Protein SIEL C-terminal Ig-like domain-containing protein n=1 Tax=Steinernema carpocapsae TaxID=34508 RepID=A0A4U5P8S5_STECR|nr:hypothetical protein L596_007282 [Steinernema carpocapsae]